MEFNNNRYSIEEEIERVQGISTVNIKYQRSYIYDTGIINCRMMSSVCVAGVITNEAEIKIFMILISQFLTHSRAHPDTLM